MKALLTIIIALFAVSFTAPTAQAARKKNMMKDFNALGGNRALLRRAKRLDPKNRVRIVQKRAVDRRWRLEVGGNFGTLVGGNSFLSTNNAGVSAELHVTPRWSFGARYFTSSNTKTSQGQRQFDQAIDDYNSGRTDRVPIFSWPTETVLGTVSFYPIYGKLNLFDLTVSQFDVYLMAGAGTVTLENVRLDNDSGAGSSTVPTYTFGGGVGVWLTNHFSTRFELRYQGYQEESFRSNDPTNVDTLILGASIGFIL